MSASDDIRRMANTLMVGHGGALLLIFNAKVEGSAMIADLPRYVAYMFAAGLIAAFWLYYLIYRNDVQVARTFQTPDQLLDAMKQKNELESWMGRWFMLSCALFVLGLMTGIHLLELRSN